MSKGQGLSITTIVVAAIALLILVVLVAVFTGQFGGFAVGVKDCRSKGGDCYDSCDVVDAVSTGQIVRYPARTDCGQIDNSAGDGKQVCCISPEANV